MEIGRPYRPDDLLSLCGLLEAQLAAGRSAGVSVAELRQVLVRRSVDAVENGRVWVGCDGSPIGFALLWRPYDTVLLLGSPELAAPAIEWTVARARELALPRLRFRPRDDELALIRRLERHGFAREEWSTVRFRRALDDEPPEAALPVGFAIRHLHGEDEVEAYVALHRESFGTENMTVEERLAFMRDPGYVPELDLVAVTPDGALAAFVVSGVDVAESRVAGACVGYTDPIGTRPAYRRRGLSRALLREAFRRLKARGVAETHAGTGSWNTATIALLESVGYRQVENVLAYARTP